ncbi:AraC family transcriptional regulator [Demequina sp.]|uniref:helix-turn-helix domain-containing protein n=1 Tax=Demequina sp. TaxID=2050685 RepID=UPI0025B91751|nr:AraC family transcriptional regulator [Demequina sp.]
MSVADAESPVYMERQPSPALTGVVRRLWYLSAPTRGTIERILPIPYVHAIANLGEPYVVMSHGETPVGLTCAGAFVSGLQSTYLVNRNPAHLHHVGAELEPFAWRAFGVDPFADEVRGAGPILPLVDGVSATHHGTRDADAALDALDAALVNSRAGVSPDPVAIAVAREIAKDPDTPIAEVARRSGITPSAVAAAFRRATGVTPKAHADVHRFHQFLRAISEPGELPTWTELVARSSYYDQPHFIRSFTRFAGISPRAYVRALGDEGRAGPSFLATDAT